MEVSKDDLSRAYRATGEAMEWSPYERNYGRRGNEWLEPTGSQPEMDRGRRWTAAVAGPRTEMDDRRWITRDG